MTGLSVNLSFTRGEIRRRAIPTEEIKRMGSNSVQTESFNFKGVERAEMADFRAFIPESPILFPVVLKINKKKLDDSC